MIRTVNSFSALPSRDEVFCALGIRDTEAKNKLTKDVDSAIAELGTHIKPRACFDTFKIKADGDWLDLGFAKVQSRDLAKNLCGCNSIILIAATVGLDVDRLIAKYSRISPSRALIMQAAGAAAVEHLLDEISNSLKRLDAHLRPRFSCGYGDLPLTLQKDIFSALSCEKSIGVSLTDSLLMTPTKSVSAIIGIENEVKNEL